MSTQERNDKIMRMWTVLGYSHLEIARKFGMTRGQVATICQRHGGHVLNQGWKEAE